MKNNDMQNIEERINELSSKIVSIESRVETIDSSNEFDYQKVLSAIRYLYRYYDDMNKEKKIEITSELQ